ncbi:uncharacterized protein B0H18DRAFT_1058535, partial [Fomitopsis serialis]|uniref:uncharacterized protein n=1 Tax=Fomitopsis serialis TaxID=139415 RepID=UPI0020077587
MAWDALASCNILVHSRLIAHIFEVAGGRCHLHNQKFRFVVGFRRTCTHSYIVAVYIYSDAATTALHAEVVVLDAVRVD